VNRFLSPIVVLAGVATFGLGACSSDSDSTSTTKPSGTNQIVGPVMADITTVDGTTVDVALSRVLVISAAEPAKWTATIADPSILSFQAGTSDGSAAFNPGFTPLKAGSTEVTMTDGATTVTFTVTVTA